MKTVFESKKLDWCKDELKALIMRLLGNQYKQTAEAVFDQIAHTGVETDLNPELKHSPTFEEFFDAE